PYGALVSTTARITRWPLRARRAARTSCAVTPIGFVLVEALERLQPVICRRRMPGLRVTGGRAALGVCGDASTRHDGGVRAAWRPRLHLDQKRAGARPRPWRRGAAWPQGSHRDPVTRGRRSAPVADEVA